MTAIGERRSASLGGVLPLCVLGGALGACRPSPDPPATSTAPPAAPADAALAVEPDQVDRLLAALPPETETVIALDFARFRAARSWQALRALAAPRPEDRARIEAFVARTGLDPFAQVDHGLAAFPRDARTTGAFVAVLDGRDFDERRLVAYARETARARGGDLELEATPHGHVWRPARAVAPRPDARSLDDVAAFFAGKMRFVLGRAGWAERTQGGLAGGATPLRRELVNLIARTRAPDQGDQPALWLASLTPGQLSAALQAPASEQPLPPIARWGLALYLDPGLRVRVRVELPHAQDAEALARRFEDYLRALRGDPRVLLLGLTGYLDQVRVVARGPDLELRAALDDAQVAALLERVAVAQAARRRAAGRGVARGVAPRTR